MYKNYFLVRKMDEMDPEVCPEEIWIKILMHCNVADILAVSRTCKFFGKLVESEYLWKKKWSQYEVETEFEFLKLSNDVINYKEACLRLNDVLDSSDIECLRCTHCLSFSCNPMCVEDRGAKVVVDIGNKFTWIVTPSFGVRRHFSLYGIPKTEQESMQDRRVSGPFCMFCNPVKLYREKKRVRASASSCGSSRYSQLLNGFCTDTVDILGIPNMDVVSPAAALLQDEQFPIVRDFIKHLFHQMGLIPTLQKPNAMLVFCEPLAMSNTLRIKLLHYLFRIIKVSRVCMVSKPLATCAMLGLETCIVVDSGALSTSVAVVLNGKVIAERWRDIPIGGWHVSEHLKEAMQWHPDELIEIPVSYLDTLQVKEKCRLSYNFAFEERRKGQARRENINLRVDSYADYKQFWKVSLGSELYVAPELMYISMRLPQTIKEVTEGLPREALVDCLGHILLTGGNTDLAGFKIRVARDLRDLFPDYSTILDVKTCPGSSSWSVAMGSTYIAMPRPDFRHRPFVLIEGPLPGCKTFKRQSSPTPPRKPQRETGSPFWMTREEYILYGCDTIDDDGNG